MEGAFGALRGRLTAVAIWIALSGSGTAIAARLPTIDEFSDAEEVFG